MAVGTPIYGNTLTDLMSGKNAAQGLVYNRQNSEDATSEARLEAFLRLQGQKYVTQAQQNALAADRAMKMAELVQQNNQFNTSENNRLTMADKVAASQLAVANASKGGLDPRAFETILAYNQQGQDKEATAQALSAKRQSLMKEIAAFKDRHWYGNGSAAADFKAKYGREPDAQTAITQLNALDSQAAPLGLIPNETTWGYDYKPFTPIVPGQLRGGAPAPNPNAGQSPLPTTSVTPQIPAMLQGDVTIGGTPLNTLLVAPPVDALAPATVAPRVNLRWNGNDWVQ